MSKQEVQIKIKQFIYQIKGIDQVQPTDRLQEDLGFDSLNLVDFFLLIEDNFSITFKESDLNPNQLQTVADVIRIVYAYLA